MADLNLLHVIKPGSGHHGIPSESLGATDFNGAVRVSGLYVHVPFCFHKCHYCDFFSIVDTQDREAAFVARLSREMECLAGILEGEIETIFIGGGTPTLLSVISWESFLGDLARLLPLASDLEFTVEANPETVTDELAERLASGGVTRISIGAQSFNPGHLKTLERWHEPANVGRSVDIFRTAGFASINLDLIFAIPGQTQAEWIADLDAALEIQPDHLSCYGLTYEANTPMTVRRDRGDFAPVDEDVEAEMYEVARERLAGAGFTHYEISAWARPGQRCRHNLGYWTGENWWPLGPAAAGHVDGLRWKNVPRLTDYLGSEGLSPVVDIDRPDEDRRVGDDLMMGLRLLDGMSRDRIESLLARGHRGDERKAAIGRHLDTGLLQWREDRLCLSDRGLLLADEVLIDLI